jgi:hypothetical protein
MQDALSQPALAFAEAAQSMANQSYLEEERSAMEMVTASTLLPKILSYHQNSASLRNASMN